MGELSPGWVLVVVGVSAVIGLTTVGVAAILVRGRPWTQAANRLSRRITAGREQRDADRAWAEGVFASQHALNDQIITEVRRLRAQVTQRPPSDPTVRLGLTPNRTERLSRLDPGPAPNGQR